MTQPSMHNYLRKLAWPRHTWCAVLLLLYICHTAEAETIAQIRNPRKTSGIWVSDMAQVLSPTTEKQLNTLITNLERKTTAEIAVVTIRRTDGSTPAAFATKLFNHWGIGKRTKNNGVLVLLVMEARHIKIETGLGMGRTLPDAQVKTILDQQVVPRFRKGDFDGGVLAGVKALAQKIKPQMQVSSVIQSRQ